MKRSREQHSDQRHQETLADAESVADGLRLAFSGLLHAVPDAATVSARARALGVTRPVCQRVHLGIRCRTGPIDTIEKFPGVKGLQGVIDGAERIGVETSLIDAATQATDAYARLIDDAGGSQARLVERFATTADEAADTRRERLRRQIFEAQREIFDGHSHARIMTAIFSITDDETWSVGHVGASGAIGVTLGPNAPPMIRVTGALGGEPGDRRGTARTPDLFGGEDATGFTPGAIIRSFSTDPQPFVTAQEHAGKLIQCFKRED
ncbi:MAG: hypothetical protein AAFX05_09515, partial [Planctomycetota bacterium]